MWNIDRFNPRQGNQLADARLSQKVGSHSTAEAEMLLIQINRDRLQATSLITTAIECSWIGYANAMGLVFQETKTFEKRPIVTMANLRQALRHLSLTERHTAVYFLTGYTRDVLYSQVMWGTTHQLAVEDYVLMKLNATFAISRSAMKPGHKTCVGLLYAQIYNHKKQKMQRAVLPSHMTIAVGMMQGKSNTPNWKQPKEIYFVHTRTNAGNNTTLTISEKVRKGFCRMSRQMDSTNNSSHYT
jgi:hypothetical protein